MSVFKTLKKATQKKKKDSEKPLSNSQKELLKAINDGKTDKVTKIIKKLISKKGMMFFDENGNTPIHVAAMKGKHDILCILLIYGFKVTKNKEGKFPMNITKNNDCKNALKAHELRQRLMQDTIASLEVDKSKVKSEKREKKPVDTPKNETESGSAWDQIKSDSKSIIASLSVTQIEKKIDEVREYLNRMTDLNTCMEESYMEGQSVGKADSTWETALSSSRSRSKKLLERLKTISKDFQKYKNTTSKLIKANEKQLEEMKSFLNEIETEHEKKKEDLKKDINVVGFIKLHTDLMIKKRKEMNEKLEEAISLGKLIQEKDKKLQKSKLQLQLNDLNKKVSGEKLKKEAQKLQILEKELMEEKRRRERIVNDLSNYQNGFLLRSKLNESLNLHDGVIEMKKTFLTNSLDNFFSFLLHKNKISDRTLEDYTEMQQFNLEQRMCLAGNLKFEKVPTPKILKIFSINDIKKPEISKEIEDIIQLKSKYFNNINTIFFYESVETKEKKVAVEMECYDQTFIHWLKKEESSSKVKNVLKTENERTKEEIKKYLKQILKGIKVANDVGMKYFKVDPLTIFIDEQKECVKFVKYSINEEDIEETFLTQVKLNPRPIKVFVTEDDVNNTLQQNLFFFGQIMYLCFGTPSLGWYKKGEEIPDHFNEAEKEILTSLLISEEKPSIEDLLKNRFFKHTKKVPGTLKVSDFSADIGSSGKKYPISFTKKANSVTQPILKCFAEMKTVGDLTARFKCKYGVDQNGNIKDEFYNAFFKQCLSKGVLEGSESYLPADDDAFVLIFECMGKIVLKFLMEKKKISLPFSPYVYAYILEAETESLSQLFKYAQYYNSNLAKGLMSLINLEEVEKLSIMWKGEKVTDNNKERYVTERLKEILNGKSFRMVNLKAMKRGFWIFGEKVRELSVEEVINFFK